MSKRAKRRARALVAASLSQIWGQIPTPTRLTRKAVGLEASGNHREAMRTAQLARRLFPTHPMAVQTMVNLLVGDAAVTDSRLLADLDHVTARLLAMSERSPQHWNVLKAVIALEVANRRIATTAQCALADSVGTFPLQARTTASAVIQRLIGAGDLDGAVAFGEWCRERSQRPEFLWPLLTAYTEAGRIDDAARVREILGESMPYERRGLENNTARAQLRLGDARGAVGYVLGLKQRFDQSQSSVLLDSWRLLGDHEAVLRHLSNTDSGLAAPNMLEARFISEWALGQLSAAETTLSDLESLGGFQIKYAHLYRAVQGAEQVEKRLMEQVASLDLSVSANVRMCAEAWWELGAPDQGASVLLDARARSVRLDSTSLLLLARCLYASRRFDEASSVISSLRWTTQEWAATKLQARIDIELGRFDDAVQNRRAHGRPMDGPDEALYHGLLGLGRHDEAFAETPNSDDWRQLCSVFPKTAERHPTSVVGHRFVIADAGPGDELQDATCYDVLQRKSERLTVTCDPRLESILSRSFPQVDFVPVRRQLRDLEFGSHALGMQPRADNSLSRFLTADAMMIAVDADSVVLGRAVKSCRDYTAGPLPHPPHIVVDPQLDDEWSSKLGSDKPTVGIVWRSEFGSSFRNIHYMTVRDIEPLVTAGWEIVCLQYDASESERETLSELSGGNVRFVDGVDLRNDFERCAAVVKNLDVVIGIGTSTSVLAASVGTPTFFMHTTRFSTWLSADAAGHDFWYAAGRGISVEPPWDRSKLVRATQIAVIDHLSR